MKTSIQISVIDQHINSTDARHFNTLTSLIWSTCLCVYMPGIPHQMSLSSLRICAVIYMPGLLVQARKHKNLLWMCEKVDSDLAGLLMDTFVVAEFEPSGHRVALRPQSQPSKECISKQPMIFNTKCNLSVSVAKSRYINSETWCRAWPMTGASWMKCWMDSLCSLQVEVNSNPTVVLLGLLINHSECRMETANVPACYREQWIKTRIKAKVWNQTRRFWPWGCKVSKCTRREW